MVTRQCIAGDIFGPGRDRRCIFRGGREGTCRRESRNVGRRTVVDGPVTGVGPGPLTVKVAVVIVEAFIASLNDAVMTATPVAPSAGLVEVTVGATVSTGGTGSSEDEPHPAIATSSTASGHAAKWLVR